MTQPEDKQITAKKLAIIITISTLITPIIVLYISFSYPITEKWVYLLFAILVGFLVNYIITVYLLNVNIIRRIRPIYGKIDVVEKLDEPENYMDKDLIADVNEQVIDWAKQKAKENRQLRENDILRKEFISNVAHELKTPIFNIQGYIDTLLDGGIYDEHINMRYLERTEKNVNRLIATIKDVDTISRLESGRVMLEYSNFDLRDLVHEVIEIQERLMERYKIRVEFKHKGNEPIWVRADREKTYEIINNLVINSIKYGQEGGLTKISVHTEADKHWIKVADNGIGIPAEHQPHIFTRFYRVDKSRSRERGGSGLGLAIVKHIIEAHNQTIRLESEPGKGTTFIFSVKRGTAN